jgi:hypothetical protein
MEVACFSEMLASTYKSHSVATLMTNISIFNTVSISKSQVINVVSFSYCITHSPGSPLGWSGFFLGLPGFTFNGLVGGLSR